MEEKLLHLIESVHQDFTMNVFYFQVGRSSESPIDFVVMDTLPGDKKDAKVMQSTISRFACRILVERTEAPKAKIYAAGFDSSRNIFLGVSLININISICCVVGAALQMFTNTFS